MENRFINLFSAEAQSQIEDLIKISQDNELLGLLKSSEKINEDDKLIQALIHQGQNEIVDRLIGYLQFMLERKVPQARVNGAAGMRLSRAAFGVMIKFSDFTDSIQNLVDEIDLLWEDLSEDPERDLKIREALKTVPNFDSILKRWESASKMRTWISDKKKNLVNRITREVESDYIKKKQEKKDEPQPSEEKKEEKPAEVPEEEK
jgi:hypothetical protein